MFCSQCGEEIRPGTKFCAYCGSPAPKLPASSTGSRRIPSIPKIQKPIRRAASTPTDIPISPNNAPSVSAAAGADRGMVWYHIIIYLQLFAAAVAFIGAGIVLLTGSHYGNAATYVYALMPSLHTYDILFGISVLAFAVYCIYVRFSLAKYEQKGPTLYLWVYVLSIVLPGIYLLLYISTVGRLSSYAVESVLKSSTGIELVMYFVLDIVMIIVNKIYFDKRKHLFIN